MSIINGWLRSQATIQNLVFVLVSVIAAAGWVRDRQHDDEILKARVAIVEAQLGIDREQATIVYARRDVLLEMFRAIEQRLMRIEVELERIRR